MIEFVKGHLPFPGTASKSGKWTAEDDRLAQLIEVFGPFPDSLLRRGARSREFFDGDGMQLSHASRISCHLPVHQLSRMTWAGASNDLPSRTR